MNPVVTADPAIRTAFEADASGLHLVPDAVARPSSESQVLALLREASQSRTPVTCAGGQTSTTAASITDSGILLSLLGLNQIGDIDRHTKSIRVQSGVLLGDLKRLVAADGYLLAPDPTSEDECTVGGAIACNASGARTYKYGAMRQHVRALRVALANGEVLDLHRPQLEKNTVGYALAHDPVDWFIGSEGTLGVVIEAELSLLPLPEQVVGIAIPFRSEADALAFIVTARESSNVAPRCLEYFDGDALAISRTVDEGQIWASNAQAMVYVEQEVVSDLDDVLAAWLALAESAPVLDDLRVFASEAELRHARRLRHAVPATMNERGARQRAEGGRKVSTDWAVPYRRLAEMVETARIIANRHGIEQAVIYGHAGNGHPHQNFIARDANELALTERVVEETLHAVLAMGGTIAAEHGIGKLKRRWLPLQMNAQQLGVMRAIKQELDPHGLLAPGNVI